MKTPTLEAARDRFDIPVAWRDEEARRVRAVLAPIMAGALPNRTVAEILDVLVPFIQDEAARVAHHWLRRHQMGDRYLGWVDPATAVGQADGSGG